MGVFGWGRASLIVIGFAGLCSLCVEVVLSFPLTRVKKGPLGARAGNAGATGPGTAGHFRYRQVLGRMAPGGYWLAAINWLASCFGGVRVRAGVNREVLLVRSY